MTPLNNREIFILGEAFLNAAGPGAERLILLYKIERVDENRIEFQFKHKITPKRHAIGVKGDATAETGKQAGEAAIEWARDEEHRFLLSACGQEMQPALMTFPQ